MVKFPLNGGSYTSQSVNADCQTTRNWYPERVESDGKVVLYPSPGLKQFCDLDALDTAIFGFHLFSVPTPPCGLFEINGLFLAYRSRNNNFGSAYSGAFYNIKNDGTAIHIQEANSTIAALQDAAPITIAASKTQIVAAGGGSVGVVYNVPGGFATVVAFDDGSGPLHPIQSVAYIDGYFLYLMANTNQVYFSHLNDATLVNPLDTFIISVTADNVLAMISDHRELWLYGEVDSLVYTNTGDADNPFQINPSGFIQQGIGAPASLVQLDNTMFFIGGDSRGSGIAWRINGYTPQRVSTHAIETAWQSYSTIADAVGYPFQDQGHSFWQIYFPTANKTWVYDITTQLWHERSHLISTTGVEEAHRSWNHSFSFGKHLVGDWFTTNIYEMKIPQADGSGGWTFVTDNGDLIKRTRRASAISANQKRMNFREMQVYLEPGLGPIPPFGVAPIAAPNVALLNVAGGVAAGTYNIILANYDASGNLTQVSDQSNTTILAPRVLQIGVPAGTLWYIFVSTDGGVTWVNGTQSGAGTFSLSAASLAAMTPSGTPPVAGYRGPQLMLRWSNNGAHTWPNEYMIDCGQSGQFSTRVIQRRLGQGRNRVFEISATDPIPWRIIDGFVLAEECDS